MDRQVPPRLIDGHELEGVDVDMGGTGHGPQYRLGDILRLQRLGPFVDPGGLFLVSLEADGGKLRLRHPGRDARHPHPRPEEIGPQIPGELGHERLRPPIDVPPRIRPVPCRRADIDDMPPVALHHPGEEKAGAVHHPLDVGVDHHLPVVEVDLVGGVETESEPRIIEKDVDLAERFGQLGDGSLNALAIANVELRGMYLRLFTQFVTQPQKGIETAGSQNEAPPLLRKKPRTGTPETGRCAGDEYRLFHDDPQ